MSRTLVAGLVVLVLACAQTRPVEVKAAEPVSPKTSAAVPSQGEAEATCRESQPRCRFPYAVGIWPPHPCANQGAACTNQQLAGFRQLGWSCGCDECRNDGDCPAGEVCRPAQSCEYERLPSQCVDANKPAPEPCPERPAPP